MIRAAARLETERLLLRHWAPADLDAWAVICADPEVMRHIGAGRPLSRAESERSLERYLDHWDRHGFGLWAAEERAAPGVLVGFVGLMHLDEEVEIGWRLARARWGLGLATEGALAARDHAFRALGLERIVAHCRPANAASSRVMEKIGMRFERRAERGGGPTLVYAMTVEEWTAQGPAG